MRLILPLKQSFVCQMIGFFICLQSATGLFYSEKSYADDKHCFCELKGSINDCTCTVDTVDYFNNNKIYPRLKSLLVKDYFRFYKTNLNKECPFWVADNKCAIRYCQVNSCAENDVPEGIKGQYQTEAPPFLKYIDTSPIGGGGQTPSSSSSSSPASQSSITACNEDHNDELSFLNTSISQRIKKGFARWADYDELEENFCVLDDHQEGAEYVDLLLNPERYTGYRGESAHKIWRSIYMENCFNDNQLKSLISSPYKGLCMEQRAFYRLISGLHSSINIHLCSNYLQSEPNDFIIQSPNGMWGRNKNEFRQRFSPETTNNEGPLWLKNLYFAYLIELRALEKAAPLLKNERYFTGNEEEDIEVRKGIDDLINIIESFPSHFNESLMFTGGSYESLKIKSEFKEKFRNISKIMDCVGCDKCRLWGKLQIQGLGTALKILFPTNVNRPKNDSNNDKLHSYAKLRRTEIVSLFNAFGCLSNSIKELEEFRRILR